MNPEQAAAYPHALKWQINSMQIAGLITEATGRKEKKKKRHSSISN